MRDVTGAGKKIAAARVRAKLTGKQLAERAGVTPSWIRSVETGRTAQPAPDKLARVAAELGLDVRELLALTDQLGAAALVTSARPAEAGDQSEVAAAIRDQTAALAAQTQALDRLAAAIEKVMFSNDARSQLRAEFIVERLEAIAATVGAPSPEEAARRLATPQSADAEPDPPRHRRKGPNPKARLGPPRPGWEDEPSAPEMQSRAG